MKKFIKILPYALAVALALYLAAILIGFGPRNERPTQVVVSPTPVSTATPQYETLEDKCLRLAKDFAERNSKIYDIDYDKTLAEFYEDCMNPTDKWK